MALNVRDPRDRWTFTRWPPLNPAFALAEVVWIVNGRQDAEFLNRWNSRLPLFAGAGPRYEGAYGYRLRTQFGIDQLRRVCEALSSDRSSRQVLLQFWDPKTDMPSPDGRAASPDVPCNICSMLKIRGGRLYWTQVMRSNDVFLGLPYNLVQFTFLQEIIAGSLNVTMGEYCHFSDSLHAYDQDLNSFGLSESTVGSDNTDFLRASLQDSDQYFHEIAFAIEAICDADARECIRITQNVDAPEPYRNIVAIISAERARRLKVIEEVESCLLICTNPALKQMFRLWQSSRRSASTKNCPQDHA